MRQSDRNDAGWLVKWEVTHFTDLIYDTQQISIIRGGSERAAAAAAEVAHMAEFHHGAQVVYAAASQALFHLRVPEEERAKALALAMEEKSLRGDVPVPSVAAWTKAPAPGAKALREAMWDCERQIRLRRTGRLGLYPGQATNASALDAFDQVRLADGQGVFRDGQEQPMSRWNRHRFQCGLQEYRLLARVDPRWLQAWKALDRRGREPSSDLQALAEAGSSRNLIGVIYADGVGFTNHREQAGDLDSLKMLSEKLETFMHAVLREAISPDLEEALQGSLSVMPVHRLLGAGDEFLLICRSHRALPIAQAIHRVARRKSSEDPGIARLSLAVGVVIGHWKSPLRQLRRLAHEMESSAKDRARQHAIPAMTDFAVLRAIGVPESSVRSLRDDLLGIGRLRREHFELKLAHGTTLRLHGRPLTEHRLAQLQQDAATLRSELSTSDTRRLLRELAAKLLRGSPPSLEEVRKTFDETCSRIATEHLGVRDVLKRLGEGLSPEHEREPCLPLFDLEEVLEVLPCVTS